MSFAFRAPRGAALVVLVVLACLTGPALAATSPLTERIDDIGARVFGDQGLANHVFGYRFRVTEPGEIDALAGRFDGTKMVVLVDATDTVLGSVAIDGDADDLNWGALGSPVAVDPGEDYRVLVRAGTPGTSSAIWTFPMPFVLGGVRVVSLEQGWSSATNPAQWVSTARTLSDHQARGLVDIRFVPDETLDPGNPYPQTPAMIDSFGQTPSAADPYPQTPGVIDSFGQTPPTAERGPGFEAVAAYYRDFPRENGECSIEVHDSYWVQDAKGVQHPTWHPDVDFATNCRFGHEHGDDPRDSALYAFSGGLPFGVTHGGGHDGHGVMRHEDHVGHKVVSQDNWRMVRGKPQNGSGSGTEVIVPLDTTCDWLSKLHQGSSTIDALANNAHEYFLNLKCSDGVQLRLKQLITFGPPELVTNICGSVTGDEKNAGYLADDGTPLPLAGDNALRRSDRTSQLFPSGVTATSGAPVVNPLDGKREFACLANFEGVASARLEELWKPDGVIEFRQEGNGYIQFSPYYVVLNPARYVDHRWTQRVDLQGNPVPKPNAYVSSLDLCFEEEYVVGGAPRLRFCDAVPDALADLGSEARQRDPRSPMNGTHRVVHPKSIIVVTDGVAGTDPMIRFCTDRLGRGARVLTSDDQCADGEIEQLASRTTRRSYDSEGSDVNSTTRGGTTFGAGYLNEWVRDFRGLTGIRFPN